MRTLAKKKQTNKEGIRERSKQKRKKTLKMDVRKKKIILSRKEMKIK
jgi:hypothetical protein